MSDFGDKGENKPLEIMEESEVNVLRNQQYEEGIKEHIEDNADGLNQSSHLSDTTTSMSTSESCYVGTSEENTVFAHINKDGKTKSTQLLCEPCSTDSIQVEATFFCKTCDDPDPLCETCAKHHLKQKISKDHQMCGKIEEFRNVEQKQNTCVSEKLLCEPCSTDNVQVEATHFCKTCDDPDPLCATCAKHHLKQKLSKSHEVSGDIEEFRKMEQQTCENVAERLLCEPCSTDNVQVKANHFCKTCDDPDPLCETCAKHHLKQKLSKDHEMCEKIEEFKKLEQKTCGIVPERLLCEPCSTDNVQVDATHFCKTCDDPDPLCKTCAKYHLKQKLSKNHEMCGEIEEFRKMEHKTCDNMSEKLLCEPCSTDNVQVEATHFCKTCDDPDPLCETCAKHHLKQKLSKNHEMCADIKEYPYKDQQECENVSTKLLCEPCSTDDLHVEATHFCKTCDDPDPLCETCAKHHLKQKLSKNHEICVDMKELQKEQKECKKTQNEKKILCIPCSNDKVDVKATHFCKTCKDPEPLCESCAKQHTRQKLARNHDVCADLTDFSTLQPKKGKNENQIESVCNPCFNENIKVPATHFCKTCQDPEPFCDMCAKQHTRQKLFREHELCKDMQDLTEQNIGKNEKQMELVCNPCFNENIKVPATQFCTTCQDPEPFCDMCAKQHTRQKIFREHELCKDMRDFIEQNIGKNEKQMELVCNPCFNENIKVPATHFCKTCQDPEPFCDMCAKQHTRQKIFREHELCKDMRDFTEQNIGSSIINNPEKSKKGNRLSPPGKPKVLNCTTESIECKWSKCKGQVDFYKIRYKTNNKTDKEEWNYAKTDADESQITITGLTPNTMYIFQVRGVFEDQEGEYGPVNDEMQTESLDAYLSKISTRITESSPSKYQLFVQEMKDARNVTAKTRKLNLGKQAKKVDEKTIMLVGATGSGKSTLVDGIVNYVLGVRFNDPFRFTLVQLEEEEKKVDNQAISQTEWVTVYRIEPQKGSRLKYALNIIDTPGFGDTRGIERDQCTVDQIRNLFTETGAKGVLFIDAVCFIVKAPDARLSVSQRYIFSSLLALFGKDIESNICTLITFADGAVPPVLASLKEANLPIGSVFEFNNSALFAENIASSISLSPMFWEMGCRSFEKFFNQLGRLATKSLSQTKDVLKERDQLRTFIASINDQVQAGLSKQGELQKEIDIMNRHKSDIQSNKDFEYEVEETKQVKTELKQGVHVTNCLNCNITCHNSCVYADDDDKINCSAMSNGYCTVCSQHCSWTVHKNARYILTYETEKVKKTYKEMKEKYEQAKGLKMNHDVLIAELNRDVNNLFNYVKHMMEEMQRSKSRLNEIALRPDPLSTVEHLDLMIQAEEMESKSGFKERIKVLQKYREMALVHKKFEDFSETYKSTKEIIESGETSTEASDKKEKKSLVRQAREGFSNFMQHFKS